MVYALGVNDTCCTNLYVCKADSAKTGWIYNSNNRTTYSSSYYIWLLSPVAGYSYGAFFALSCCMTDSNNSIDFLIIFVM